MCAYKFQIFEKKTKILIKQIEQFIKHLTAQDVLGLT